MYVCMYVCTTINTNTTAPAECRRATPHPCAAMCIAPCHAFFGGGPSPGNPPPMLCAPCPLALAPIAFAPASPFSLSYN